MTSDTRPSALPLDQVVLARALHNTAPFAHYKRKCRDRHDLRAQEIAAEYFRLLEERVAPESESELREAFGK